MSTCVKACGWGIKMKIEINISHKKYRQEKWEKDWKLHDDRYAQDMC
jgi:hypothetical protein